MVPDIEALFPGVKKSPSLMRSCNLPAVLAVKVLPFDTIRLHH